MNCLRGRTEFGDSIEDEWVIVWLLRELTTKFPNLWVKVTDSDGEFLLIEASATLPSWLEPEVAENRVWIHNGQVSIIKPAKVSGSRHVEEKLSLAEARNIVLSDPKRIMHSQPLEDEAFFRLRSYPAQIKQNMHHAILRVPRKLAYLVHENPAYVAPAVEAFYLRDPLSLAAIRSSTEQQLALPPDDLIDMSITFPRPAYAQLRSQEFPILDVWRLAMQEADHVAIRTRIESGMKLTTGFEILLREKHCQDRPAVQEMILLLSDLGSGDANLPSNADLAKLRQAEDDEQWLNVSLDDLQKQLQGKDASQPESKSETIFGDTATEQNLRRIVKQFENYLDDDKAADDSDFYDEDDNDDLDDIDSDEIEEDLKNAGYEDDDFTKLMQEMMGMPPEVLKELMHGDIDALKNEENHDTEVSDEEPGVTQEDLSSEDEEGPADKDLQDLLRRMQTGLGDIGGASGASNSQTLATNTDHQIPEAENSDEDGPLDPRKEEMAKQLLESLQAQGGASGPAANLMEIMARQYAKQDRRKAVKKGKSKT